MAHHERLAPDRLVVAGDTHTMGDIPIGPQSHRWLNLVQKRSPMPDREAWYRRLTERPALRKSVMISIEQKMHPEADGFAVAASSQGSTATPTTKRTA